MEKRCLYFKHLYLLSKFIPVFHRKSGGQTVSLLSHRLRFHTCTRLRKLNSEYLNIFFFGYYIDYTVILSVVLI